MQKLENDVARLEMHANELVVIAVAVIVEPCVEQSVW